MHPSTIAQNARTGSALTACAATRAKNAVLGLMADKLDRRREAVLEANRGDVERARDGGLKPAVVNRLVFEEQKLDWRIRCLRKIQTLPDPVGQTISAERRPNQLEVSRVRVPLGVVLMIYEARPHVTVNAGAFCLKSGNACILRGGSEARRCNDLLGKLWTESLEEAGLPADAIQVVSGSHEEVGELLQQEEHIDLVIPRGGKGLIRAVSEQSRIPVLKHFAGICHVYLDRGADLESAIPIVLDSKCLMPGVCNALETLLVAADLQRELGRIVHALREHGVRVKGCRRARESVPDLEPATEQDWAEEYLEMTVALRVVDAVEEAIEHINRWGSHHTDAIVTDSRARARRFTEKVDSGVVLVNASTMFCDGESLGMGAEIGISTDKIHARGPMGLKELTSYKFVIEGTGHVMGRPDDWR